MKKLLIALRRPLGLCLLVSCLATAARADEVADVGLLLRNNQFAQALTQADAFLAGKPKDPQMRFLRGVILRNLGRHNEAIAAFTNLTEDYPELPEPHNNLAVLYAGRGEFDRARQALEMAIRTNPSYAVAHENLGDVYARLASQAYNKALQLDDRNPGLAPKLQLIGEVFKPNLTQPAAPASASVSAVRPTLPAAAPPAPTLAPAPAASAAARPSPSAVALSPPAAATPAAPPATDAPTAAQAAEVQAVEAAVLAWAQAWSRQDMAAYLAAYSPDFDPAGGQSRSGWEKDRRDRILGKKSISVKLSNIQVRLKDGQAQASFRQSYRAQSMSAVSQKTLDLQKSGNTWLITREKVGG